MTGLVLLSIPSPSSPLIVSVGPFSLRWYGTLLAIGVLIGGWLTKRELRRRGLDGERMYTIATWCVPGGVIGARLYHVITDWDRFSGHLGEIPQLWHGGLGMPGVIAGGVAGAAIGARRAGIPLRIVMDCVAPGLIAAQALGRWGNWANQELFGGPTSLPWGVEIAPANRPAQYAGSATFHPTFLYESLWNVLVLLALFQLIRRRSSLLAPGVIFAAYLAFYAFGRFFVEGLRIDTADRIAGVRINQWLFGITFCVAAAILARGLRRGAAAPAPLADEPADPPGADREPSPEG